MGASLKAWLALPVHAACVSAAPAFALSGTSTHLRCSALVLVWMK